MNTRRNLSLIAPLLLLAACGEDAKSPTEPAAPQIVERMEITTTIVSFEAINDGDGIEGDGEFAFTVTVPGKEKSWERTVGSGSSATLNWTTSVEFNYAGGPVTTYVSLTCSEIDKDITGREYNDGDMDFRHAQVTETVTGADITNYVTMGNDECKVRLHYKITSKIIQVEM